MSDFTARIDNLLVQNGKKRADLCKATNIPESAVRSWIRNGSTPNAEWAIKVAQYFGVSVEWLITGEHEEKEIKLMLDDQEKELIQTFRSLSEQNKTFLLQSALLLQNQNN